MSILEQYTVRTAIEYLKLATDRSIERDIVDTEENVFAQYLLPRTKS